MDFLTPEKRSQLMSKIRGKNTKPELAFRKHVWEQGLKGYRLHVKLPGKPDLYFGPKKVAVFIDGCFWHQCPTCYRAPKSNKKFWNEKIKRNCARDLHADLALREQGITPLRFWEHDISKNLQKCSRTLKRAMRKPDVSRRKSSRFFA